MKRTLFATILLALAVPAFGQYGPGSSYGTAKFKGGSLTSPICAPVGSSTEPSYAWCTDPGNGLYLAPDTNNDFNRMTFSRGATTYATAGDIFQFETQDDGTPGYTRQWWRFKDPDSAASSALTIMSSQRTQANTLSLFDQTGAYGGIDLQVTEGLFGDSGNLISLTTITDGDHNALKMLTTDSATGDGYDVTSYIEFWDNIGNDYVRIQGPSDPSGTNTITVPNLTGQVLVSTAINQATAGNNNSIFQFTDTAFYAEVGDGTSSTTIDANDFGLLAHTVTDGTDSTQQTQDSTSFRLDADTDDDGDGTITLSTDNSGQTIVLDSNSIDVTSNATLALQGDVQTTITSAQSGVLMYADTDDGGDNGMMYFQAGPFAGDYSTYTQTDNSFVLNADANGDGDGSISLSTAAAATSLSLSSTGSTFVGPVTLPNGSTYNTSLRFAGNANAGLYYSSGPRMVYHNGTDTTYGYVNIFASSTQLGNLSNVQIDSDSDGAASSSRVWLRDEQEYLFGVDNSGMEANTPTGKVASYADFLLSGVGTDLIFGGSAGDTVETTFTLDTNATDITVITPNQPGQLPVIAPVTSHAYAVQNNLGTDVQTANQMWVSSGTLTWEGSSADAYETNLVVTNPTTIDKTATIPDYTGTFLLGGSSQLTVPNLYYKSSSSIEASSAGSHNLYAETGFIIASDSDEADSASGVQIADEGLTVAFFSNADVDSGIAGIEFDQHLLMDNTDIIFEGSSADAVETTLTVENPTTSDKTITLPDLTGTALLSGAANTATATTSLTTGSTDTTQISLGASQVSISGDFDQNGTGSILLRDSTAIWNTITVYPTGTGGIELRSIDDGIDIEGDSDGDGTGGVSIAADDASLVISQANGLIANATTAGLFTLGNSMKLSFNTGGGNETFLDPATASTDRTIVVPNEEGTMATVQSGQSTLTDNTATNILSFPLADGEFIAGTLVTVTKCTSVTPNTVWRHDTADFICTNQSDTESCSFQTTLGTALELNDGAGNFTAGYDLGVSTAGTNTVTITLDADCSLTPTTLVSDWEIEFHQPDWELVTELN